MHKIGSSSSRQRKTHELPVRSAFEQSAILQLSDDDLLVTNPRVVVILANSSTDVGYMSFELPAALSLRVAHPPFLYGGAVIFFGVCTVCTSAARTYASFMVLRLLLGFGESFVQTGFVFLSLWYTKEEMTTRCGASLLQGILIPWFGFGFGPQRLYETNNLFSILFRFHSTGWRLFRSNSLWN